MFNFREIWDFILLNLFNYAGMCNFAQIEKKAEIFVFDRMQGLIKPC